MPELTEGRAQWPGVQETRGCNRQHREKIKKRGVGVKEKRNIARKENVIISQFYTKGCSSK